MSRLKLRQVNMDTRDKNQLTVKLTADTKDQLFIDGIEAIYELRHLLSCLPNHYEDVGSKINRKQDEILEIIDKLPTQLLHAKKMIEDSAKEKIEADFKEIFDEYILHTRLKVEDEVNQLRQGFENGIRASVLKALNEVVIERLTANHKRLILSVLFLNVAAVCAFVVTHKWLSSG